MPSCSVNVKSLNLTKWAILNNSLINFTYKWIPVGLDYNWSNSQIWNDLTINACVNKLTYTVSNPLNPNIKTTCYDSFSAKSKNYCWDGNVDIWESCDPADGKSWMFCTTSCTLKSPTNCSIEWSDSYFVWTNAYIWVQKDTYSSIISATSNSDKIMWTSSPLSVYFKTAGTYIITVNIKNSLDKTNTITKSCTKTITVKPKEICK
jgi:hypothetical protein